MNVIETTATFVRRGLQLWPEEDKLCFRASKALLSEDEFAVLRAHKGEILRFLRGRKAVRLSGIQERLWFLSQLDTSGVGYTFSFAYRIEGPFDSAALAAALQSVVGRHPGLRATFVEVAGTPIQFIRPDIHLETPCLDCRSEPRAALLRRMRAELVAPFDLAEGPLLRSRLFRTGDEEHLWGLTLHHLIADGRTFGIIVRDLSQILAGAVAHDVSVSLDYTDYVEWERDRLTRPETEANLEYWAERLAGVPDLDLPLDRARPQVRTYDGAREDFAVPPDLSQRMEAFGRDEGVTLFAVLLSIYFVLLHQHTEREDIAVGSPHANRLDTRFEDTAGCFVSTLVLRSDLTGDVSFRQLVRQVSETCLEAWDHQDYSFERLVARLEPDRDMSRNAMFQAFFALQNVFGELTVPGATANMVPFDSGTVQFDVELHLLPGRDQELLGTFLYNPNLFDSATIRTMGKRWLRLAEQVLVTPDMPVRDLPRVSDEERADIDRCNRTEADYPAAVPVHELVTRQAQRTPDRSAVVFQERSHTYRELERATSILCHRLLVAEGHGHRVGLFLDRSAEMVAAMLATASAGAVVVPLAPDFPEDRLSWMIEDSGLTLAFTTARLVERLPAGVQPIMVDDVWDSEPVPAPPPAGPRTTEEPAYILYTSGSTGRPKGVEVSHRALVNLLCAMARQPGIRTEDVFVAITSISFDISLLEILLPLITGATLVVASQDEASDPMRLGPLFESSRATITQGTPSTWRMLLDSGWSGSRGLKVLCGGEALSRDLADRLLDRCCELWNVYGPTETTIWSARWKVERDGPVLIGEPIENTRFYVVNQRGALVPPGVPGALCIAGDGLANGYLNRAEETGRRFPDLRDVVGTPERAYRTGDLVRQMPDGTFLCLGRTDHQLKVRGHRVEPEEIEHALRSHPSVLEAVVTPGPSESLVAHILPETATIVSTQDLRDLAVSLMPTYMVPQYFRLHAQLPLTPNGKIDRKSLASLPPDTSSKEAAYEPPADEVEAFVAAVYQDILGLERVGRDDDFFRLGGHSLVAARVLFRVKEGYGVGIGLQELFRSPTVHALAEAIRTALGRREEEEHVLSDALDRLESMSEEEAAQLLASLS